MKKIVKCHFIQEWGTYTNQTLICVNLTTDEIIKAAKKEKAAKWFIDILEKDKEDIKKLMDDGARGFFMSNQGASVLWLKKFEDEWEWYEVLMHELHHAVHHILRDNKGMGDELEAQAYQQEFLFREIRHVLRDVFYKNKKKK